MKHKEKSASGEKVIQSPNNPADSSGSTNTTLWPVEGDKNGDIISCNLAFVFHLASTTWRSTNLLVAWMSQDAQVLGLAI